MINEIEIGLIARINLAAKLYYAKANEFKTEENFRAWLNSIENPGLKLHFEHLGFEGCKNTLSYMRFVLELNDVGLDNHMKAHLSNSDYELWINPSSSLVVPNEMNLIDPNDNSQLL